MYGNASLLWSGQQFDDYGAELYHNGNKIGAAGVAIAGSFYKVGTGFFSLGLFDEGNQAITDKDTYTGAAKQLGNSIADTAKETAQEYVEEGVVAGSATVAGKFACGRFRQACDKTVDVGKGIYEKLNTDIKLSKEKSQPSLTTEEPNLNQSKINEDISDQGESNKTIYVDSRGNGIIGEANLPTNYKGEKIIVPEGHIKSVRDPDFSDPPIVDPGPFTTAQREQFIKGNSADTKLAPHHRDQIPSEQGGVIDELPGPGHPAGNQHTGGSPSRHPSPSIFNQKKGGAAQRNREIKQHWQNKGGRLEEVEPDVWIDPGV